VAATIPPYDLRRISHKCSIIERITAMTHRLHLVPSPVIAPAPVLRGATDPAGRAPGARPPKVELAFTSRQDWRGGLGQLVLPLECRVANPESFECSAIVGHLHGQTVAELRMDAAWLTRREAPLGSADDELVQVLWLLAGRGRVRQGPSHSTLAEGSWTLVDPTREYSLQLGTGTRVLLLNVPRAACPGWLSALPVLAGAELRGGGPAQIAVASLIAMLREAEPLDADTDAALHESVIALVGRALTLEMQARGLEGRKDRATELLRVVAYIAEHLRDPRLNVATLARVFGVSRRNLYNIFLPSQVTPHAWIQNARLERACALLEESSAGAVSVAAIARQCGFSDPAHFSRAFRARHRVAPTGWRHRPR
jgi:AraC family transcriptional regulator, positive regulator of tynA and feaB